VVVRSGHPAPLDDLISHTVHPCLTGSDPVAECLCLGEFGEQLDAPPPALRVQPRQASGRRHAQTMPIEAVMVKTLDTP
jgi:hypothetical protein